MNLQGEKKKTVTEMSHYKTDVAVQPFITLDLLNYYVFLIEKIGTPCLLYDFFFKYTYCQSGGIFTVG